jgi:hypothetical protein
MLGFMRDVGGYVFEHWCHEHSRYDLKELEQAILDFEDLDLLGIMLSHPYLVVSSADRSCGRPFFSCVLLTTSLFYVLTWALTILLLEIDIILEGMVIACFSELA